MAGEELVFARRASGLVRGISTLDAFGMGIVAINIVYALWFTLALSLGLYPGANLIISLVICLVIGASSGVLVWGILGGTMPRSGGEYVYNSRILHPAVAMAGSMGMVASQCYWCPFVVWTLVDPFLIGFAQFFGWDSWVPFLQSTWGVFVLSVCFQALGIAIICAGMGFFTKVLKVLVAGGVLIPLGIGIAMLFVSKADFIAHWDRLAAQYDSLTYTQFLAKAGEAAGEAMPTGWNWRDSFGGIAGLYTIFMTLFTVAYVGGEVKRPDKGIMRANGLLMLVCGAIVLVLLIGLYKIMDFGFLSAAGFSALAGSPEGYTMPWAPSLIGLIFVAFNGNPVVGTLILLSYGLPAFGWVCFGPIVIQRSLFAWGMDRRGPTIFTDISPRFATPIKMYLLIGAFLIVVIAVFDLWILGLIGGLVVNALQATSVYLLVALSALLLAYRKKVKTIWDSSPYRRWKIAGVPVLTVAAVVYLGYIAMSFYFSVIDPKTRDITVKGLAFIIAVWVVGLIWFYAWDYRSRQRGVDTSVLYGELPPE